MKLNDSFTGLSTASRSLRVTRLISFERSFPDTSTVGVLIMVWSRGRVTSIYFVVGELINRDPEDIEPLRAREGFESVPVHQEVCPRLQSNVPPFLRIKRGFCLILSSIGHVRESSVVPALARSDLEIIIFFPAERV